MSLTPEQRILRARAAAHARWGRATTEERRQAVAPKQRAFLDRFLAEVDAERPGLPDVERHKLADSKLRAYMTGLALRSSRSRQTRPASGRP